MIEFYGKDTVDDHVDLPDASVSSIKDLGLSRDLEPLRFEGVGGSSLEGVSTKFARKLGDPFEYGNN